MFISKLKLADGWTNLNKVGDLSSNIYYNKDLNQVSLSPVINL